MKISNPALSANSFRLPYAGLGESVDNFGRREQDRHSTGLRRGHGGLELEPVYRRS